MAKPRGRVIDENFSGQVRAMTVRTTFCFDEPSPKGDRSRICFNRYGLSDNFVMCTSSFFNTDVGFGIETCNTHDKYAEDDTGNF